MGLTTLYLAVATGYDLRDNLRGLANQVEWLSYGDMVKNAPYQQGDILAVSNWVIPDRGEMVDAINTARRAGARVVYVGQEDDPAKAEEFKRHLVLLGVYDFYFVSPHEVEVNRIEELIAHPRSAKDVSAYLPEPAKIDMEPTFVSVYQDTIENIETPDLTQDRFSFATRVRGHLRVLRSWPTRKVQRIEVVEEKDESQKVPSVKHQKHRVLWKRLDPLRIALIGDAGAGKSQLAWNLAAMANDNELYAVVVDANSVYAQCKEDSKVAVLEQEPKTGYRLHLIVSNKIIPADAYVFITWPDEAKMEQWLEEAQNRLLSYDDIWWLLNFTEENFPMPMVLASPVVEMPFDTRHYLSGYMGIPLAVRDTKLYDRLFPFIQDWMRRYREKSEQHEEEVIVTEGMEDDVVSS